MKKPPLNARFPVLLAVAAALACSRGVMMAADQTKADPACEHHGPDQPAPHGKPGAQADPHAGHQPAAPPREEAKKGVAEEHRGHEPPPPPAPPKMREKGPMPEAARARQADRRAENQALMQRAHELDRAGKPEEAEALRRTARARMGPGPMPRQGPPPAPPGGDPPPNPVAKLRHLEQAIAHLREAGLPDPAENLEGMARRLRAEIQQQQERQQGSPEIEALRREVRELREALRQVREKP